MFLDSHNYLIPLPCKAHLLRRYKIFKQSYKIAGFHKMLFQNLTCTILIQFITGEIKRATSQLQGRRLIQTLLIWHLIMVTRLLLLLIAYTIKESRILPNILTMMYQQFVKQCLKYQVTITTTMMKVRFMFTRKKDNYMLITDLEIMINPIIIHYQISQLRVNR